MNGCAAFGLVLRAGIFAVAVLGAACAADPAGGGSAVKFTTLAQGSLSGITVATRSVIRDPASWETFWRAHTAQTMPPPPVPVVDFATLTVLAVVLGTRNTGGYGVAITAVHAGAAPAPLIVSVRETRPKPRAMVTQALTSPFHVVTIPVWTRDVQFGVPDDVLTK